MGEVLQGFMYLSAFGVLLGLIMILKHITESHFQYNDGLFWWSIFLTLASVGLITTTKKDTLFVMKGIFGLGVILSLTCYIQSR